jgi:hypothetical protein
MLKTAFTIALLMFTVGVACGNPEEVAQSCETATQGPARDECLHDQLMSSGAPDIEIVIELASRIDDPIIRGAAIFRWIEIHNREIPRERGRALCEILSDREKTSCERRLYSAHLQR